MRTFIGWALALVLGVASAQAEPIERDLAWLAAGVDEPPGDVGRDCLDQVILTLDALVAFQRGHWSDDMVRSALIHGVSNSDVLAMRKAEGDLWVQTHDPSTVAADDLGRCSALRDVRLKNLASTRSCLQAVLPAEPSEYSDEEGHKQARRLAACLEAGPAAATLKPGTAEAPCVVLLGGAGSMTGNAEIDGNWFKIDSAISNDVADQLTARSYDVRPLIIDTHDSQELFNALWSKLSETHCALTVQIFRELKASKDRADSFSIKTTVLKIIPHPGSRVVTPASEYQKEYDFPLTTEVMENLSLSTLAGRIADDIAAAGVLPKP